MATITNHVGSACTFASVRSGFRALSRQEIPCTWSDSWTFAKDTQFDSFLTYGVTGEMVGFDTDGFRYFVECFQFGSREAPSFPFHSATEYSTEEPHTGFWQ